MFNGGRAPKIGSMSSSVLPLVSGTTDQVLANCNVRQVFGDLQKYAQKPMQTINAAKKKYVPYPREVIMYGVVLEMMNDQSH